MDVYSIEIERLLENLKIEDSGEEYIYKDGGHTVIADIETIEVSELLKRLRDSIYVNKYLSAKQGVRVFLRKIPVPGMPVFVNLNFLFPVRKMFSTRLQASIDMVQVFKDGRPTTFLSLPAAMGFLSRTEYVDSLEALVDMGGKNG